MEFSVLMSVYKNDSNIFLKEALDSVIVKQSIPPNEVVIVKDGPLSEELDSTIEDYVLNYSEMIKVISLGENKGLGEALRIGLKYCSFDIVARMDSDDISHYKRFERQLKTFKENEKVDLVGTYIDEFFTDIGKIEFRRKVPCQKKDILKMLKRRNPINHVSVMFKKESVLNSGSYEHLNYLEDYYLWARMLNKGYNLINIDEALVYVRTGEKMFERRSNPEYIKSWSKLQSELKRFNFINTTELILNMINIIIFIYTPPKIKKYIYKFFLRN